jgi:hypothetical protein
MPINSIAVSTPKITVRPGVTLTRLLRKLAQPPRAPIIFNSLEKPSHTMCAWITPK